MERFVLHNQLLAHFFFITFLQCIQTQKTKTNKQTDNYYHGAGTLLYSTNDQREREKYEGEWRYGKRHGKGFVVFSFQLKEERRKTNLH